VQKDAIRKNQQRFGPFPDDGRERTIEVFGGFDSERQDLDMQRVSCVARLLLRSLVKGIDRIGQHRNVREFGYDLSQQLQPFAFQLRGDRAQSGDIAAGPRQARHDAGPDWISHRYHDKRNGCRGALDRERGRRAGSHDHVHMQS
jgi:hypothetical protein